MGDFRSYQPSSPEGASGSNLVSGPTGARVEVHDGAYSVTMRGGEATAQHHGVARHQEALYNALEGATPAEVARTATTRSGAPVAGRALRMDDLVRYQGMDVDVRQALRLGLVDPADVEGNGGFSRGRGEKGLEAVPTRAPNDHAAADEGDAREGVEGGDPEADVADGDAFLADEATEEAMTDIASTYSAETQEAIVDGFVKAGRITDDVVEGLAAESGRDAEAVAAQMHAAHVGMYEAVTARMASLGAADIDAFSSWVEEEPARIAELQGAVGGLLRSNDVAGFDRLARAFAKEKQRRR